MLWAFVAISVVFMACAGYQAVRMQRDNQAAVGRLEMSIEATQKTLDIAMGQIEAQRILLRQAETWILAQKKLHAGPDEAP